MPGPTRAVAAALFGVAALVLLAGPGPAQTIRIPGLVAGPPLIDARDPWAVAEAMVAGGHPAEVEVTPDLGPMIRAEDDGLIYAVFFYHCDGEVDCLGIQFFAGFTLDPPPALETLNAWNRDRTIGKAYLAESGAARIDHYVTLEGGVTPANFGKVLEAWLIALHDYAAHIGFR